MYSHRFFVSVAPKCDSTVLYRASTLQIFTDFDLVRSDKRAPRLLLTKAAADDRHCDRIIEHRLDLEYKVIKQALTKQDEHCRSEHGFHKLGTVEEVFESCDTVDAVR